MSFPSAPRSRATLSLADLTPGQLLARLDLARGFDPHELAEAKLGRLARYFAQHGYDAAVVAVSGGVDSALVLGMLRTLELRGQLRRVVALLLPGDGEGATRQSEATERGRLVAKAFGVDPWEAPLGEVLAPLVRTLQDASWLPFTPWAEEKSLAALRSTAQYTTAALLQAHGYRAQVVGTVNRDEGALLGLFGKASDGLADVQPISDLHKSEVRALARYFGAPEQAVSAAASREGHDGRSDEQRIGASYEDVEIYLRLRELGLRTLLPASSVRDAIERLIARNADKYRVPSAAVHLDVLPRGVPGGWQDQPLAPQQASPGPSLTPLSALPAMRRLDVPGFALQARDLLGADDCQQLCALLHDAPETLPSFAEQLWQRLATVVPSVRFLDAGPGPRSYRAVAIRLRRHGQTERAADGPPEGRHVLLRALLPLRAGEVQLSRGSQLLSSVPLERGGAVVFEPALTFAVGPESGELLVADVLYEVVPDGRQGA